MLASNTRHGPPLSVVCTPSESTFEKTISPLASGPQLGIESWLGMGTYVCFPFSALGPLLAWLPPPNRSLRAVGPLLLTCELSWVMGHTGCEFPPQGKFKKPGKYPCRASEACRNVSRRRPVESAGWTKFRQLCCWPWWGERHEGGTLARMCLPHQPSPDRC